jgi:hypothetical protein
MGSLAPFCADSDETDVSAIDCRQGRVTEAARRPPIVSESRSQSLFRDHSAPLPNRTPPTRPSWSASGRAGQLGSSTYTDTTAENKARHRRVRRPIVVGRQCAPPASTNNCVVAAIVARDRAAAGPLLSSLSSSSQKTYQAAAAATYEPHTPQHRLSAATAQNSMAKPVWRPRSRRRTRRVEMTHRCADWARFCPATSGRTKVVRLSLSFAILSMLVCPPSAELTNWLEPAD